MKKLFQKFISSLTACVFSFTVLSESIHLFKNIFKVRRLIVSIQTNFDFFSDTFDKLVEFINNELSINDSTKLVIDSDNKVINYIDCNLLSFYCSPIKSMFINFKEEDYGVKVNYSISFDHYSDLSINTSENIIKFIFTIMNKFNSDCILSHNGGEPLMIRKKGEYYIEQDERFEEALGYNVKKLIKEYIK